MDRFVGDTGLCCNCSQFFVSQRISCNFAGSLVCHQVSDTNGKTYVDTEVDYFIKFFFVRIFQYQLANGTESNYFAVEVVVVDFVYNGDTVVNSVCCCETAGFKAQT